MLIEDYIQKSINAKHNFLNDDKQLEIIKKVADIIVETYKNNKKVLTAGNGGSTADAQHIAGELVGRFKHDRPGLPAIALTNDAFILTAVGNDYGFEKIFARQIQAHGKKGDVFIGISTSGNSENIILALKEAKQRDIITVGFTGNHICEMEKYCDYILKVPSTETPIIQESHVMYGHIICALVEEKIFG